MVCLCTEAQRSCSSRSLAQAVRGDTRVPDASVYREDDEDDNVMKVVPVRIAQRLSGTDDIEPRSSD
jgi:hypothetical protein